MTNEAKQTIKNNLTKRYHEAAFTADYAFTFNYAGAFYLFETHLNANELAEIAKLDKASRGAGYSIRFRPTNAQKHELVKRGAIVVCSTEYFKTVCSDSKYNQGEVAEMLITEMVYEQTWEKDSVPFNEGADIYTDAKAIQHKHEGATFTNERTLHNLGC